MSGIVIVSLLAAAMTVMMWVALGRRLPRIEERRSPGQLSAAERRRLYRRLGIDPAALARHRQANIVWRDPGIIDRRRTKA